MLVSLSVRYHTNFGSDLRTGLVHPAASSPEETIPGVVEANSSIQRRASTASQVESSTVLSRSSRVQTHATHASSSSHAFTGVPTTPIRMTRARAREQQTLSPHAVSGTDLTSPSTNTAAGRQASRDSSTDAEDIDVELHLRQLSDQDDQPSHVSEDLSVDSNVPQGVVREGSSSRFDQDLQTNFEDCTDRIAALDVQGCSSDGARGAGIGTLYIIHSLHLSILFRLISDHENHDITAKKGLSGTVTIVTEGIEAMGPGNISKSSYLSS